MYNWTMILFLSQFDDPELKNFAERFSETSKIKCVYKNIFDVVNNSLVTIKCENNKFSFMFDKTDFNEIKLCFINYNLTFYSDLFNFDDKLDNVYAAEEWNATFVCLLTSAEKTKFINPYCKKSSLSNQIENNILFQKFGIDTTETILTNNHETLMDFYQAYNYNLLIKNVISSSRKMKVFDINSIKKLDRLYLSPYIFQKMENGYIISVLLAGDSVIAINEYTRQEIELPVGLKEKLIALRNYVNEDILKFSAVQNQDKYYFFDIDDSNNFSLFYQIFGGKYKDILTEFLLREYKN